MCDRSTQSVHIHKLKKTHALPLNIVHPQNFTKEVYEDICVSQTQPEFMSNLHKNDLQAIWITSIWWNGAAIKRTCLLDFNILLHVILKC